MYWSPEAPEGTTTRDRAKAEWVNNKVFFVLFCFSLVHLEVICKSKYTSSTRQRVFQILFCSFSVALPLGFPNPVDQHFDLQGQEPFHWKKRSFEHFQHAMNMYYLRTNKKFNQTNNKKVTSKNKKQANKKMCVFVLLFFAAWHLIQRLIIRHFINSQLKQHLIEWLLTERNFMRTSSQNLLWGQIQVSLRVQDHSTWPGPGFRWNLGHSWPAGQAKTLLLSM